MSRTIFQRQLLARLLLSVAAASFVVWSVLAIKQDKPPRLEDETIAKWFDGEVRENPRGCGMMPRNYGARNAIIGAGEQAIPFLIEKAQERPSLITRVHDQLWNQLSRCLPISLMMRLPISQSWRIPEQRSTAIGLLGEITDRDGLSRDGTRRVSPSGCDAVYRCLLTCLSRSNETAAIHTRVIEAVGSFPSRSSEIAPRLLLLTSHQDASVAEAALSTIGRLGNPTQETITKLMHVALSSGNYGLRVVSLQAMTRLAQESTSLEHDIWNAKVIETMRALCANRDRYIRQEASVLMWQLGHPEYVSNELRSPGMGDRWFMLDRLQAEAMDTSVFAPEMRGMLDDPALPVRNSVALILTKLDKPTP